MSVLLFLLRKEFKQIFRDRAILPLIFIVPIMQLLLLPLAANFEVKNIAISVVDHDHSSYSRQLIQQISASAYFKLQDYGNSYSRGLKQIESDKVDLVLEIPKDFEKNLIRESESDLLVAVNAINGVKAGLGASYINQIIQGFNADVRMRWVNPDGQQNQSSIDIRPSNWFNPNLIYSTYMVPGILVALVTMLCSYMCALNIVKEKEVGTIEQINVTPIKKYQFILGKLIPFWIIGLFVFTLGLFVVARFVYGIVPVGNMFLLYGYLSIYLIAILGLGLLISTFSDTQQQAMSIAFLIIMVFMLMTGLFTSIDSMPDWAYFIARLLPVTYFIEVVRMLVLKGSGFGDIQSHFLIIIAFALVLNGLAIYNYKKTA